MSILLLILGIALLAVSAWLGWKSTEVSLRKFYWPALGAKLISGILVGVIYSRYYQETDTQYFFQAATQWSQQAISDFPVYLSEVFSSYEGYFQGEERLLFMIKLTSVFTLLSANNYWITSFYFSILSFFGAWYLARTVRQHFPNLSAAAIVSFLFFPSCLFWTSGIMKESLAMAGVFCLVSIFLRLWFSRISVIEVVLALISIAVVWKLKYYYLGILIPVMVAAWTTRTITLNRNKRNLGVEVILFTVLVSVMIFLAGFVHPNFSVEKTLEVMVANNQEFVRHSAPNDVIHYTSLEPTVSSVVYNSPWALFSGLFRPFVWESNSWTQVVAALENLLLFVLIAYALRLLKEAVNSEHRLLILSVVVFSVLLCVFLSISTPNFGTLVRYRIGFLPFLVLLVVNRSPIADWVSKVFKI